MGSPRAVSSSSRAIGGRVHDVYIGDSETIELSCALDKPDQNSGEQILFELASSFYQDTATPATASTVTLTGWGRDDFDPDSSNDLIVVQGKGLGQRRAITAWDPDTMVATVEPPFTVVPDDTTRIQIARAVTDFIVYRSWIQGKPDFADRHTASSGVQPLWAWVRRRGGRQPLSPVACAVEPVGDEHQVPGCARSPQLLQPVHEQHH